MERDEFESWVEGRLSEAIEELQDVSRSKRSWILALSNALTRIAKDEESDEEPGSTSDDEPDDDDLDLDDEEDEE